VIRRASLLAAAALAATLAACATRGAAPRPSTPAPASPAEAPAAPPLDVAALTGDWARRELGAPFEGMRLGEDGSLVLVGHSPPSGVGWRVEGRTLTLQATYPGSAATRTFQLPIRDAVAGSLLLEGDPDLAGEWRRATFTTVSGTVTYRQREALTPEAVVFVDLRDAGGAPEDPPLARARIGSPGQVPIAFTLTYDPASLDPSRSYALSARIVDRGELRFVTEKAVALPAAGDAPPVEIAVGPVR
jgi:putative lipoprotein